MVHRFMRAFFSLLVIFQMVALSSTAQQSHATATSGYLSACKQACLEDGTPVKLRISQTVSSADAHVDDRVEFEVLEEIKILDVVIIPKGGIAWGTITEAVPKRRMARGGKLEIVMDSVRLVDGEKTALRATKTAQGGGHTGGMTAGIVATGLIFWPAAPFFLFMHGKDVTIPKGAEVPTFVSGNLPLDLAKFQQAAPVALQAQASLPVSGAGSSLASQTATDAGIDVTSNPSGADVELDGDFVGNTPSTIGVAPGDHTIRVKKNGYKAWEKKIRVSSGKVSVAAELDAEVIQGQTGAVATAMPHPAEANQEVEVAIPSKAAALPNTRVVAPESLGTITVTSNPTGAVVYIDTSYSGKTPAILHLTPGQHSVRVFAKDYKNWWRPVTVSAGSEEKLMATMEKSN
jgi:hypothetical protein